jgi:hypothetical protein
MASCYKITTGIWMTSIQMALCVTWLPTHFTQSTSIGIYRPQAQVFGGRSDGKFGVPPVEVSLFQVLISAGDD